MMTNTLARLHGGLNLTRRVDFLAPLLLRLYLGPVFISAGLNKALAWENTVTWFGNADWGLGLPLPGLMAFLAVSAELVVVFCSFWVWQRATSPCH